MLKPEVRSASARGINVILRIVFPLWSSEIACEIICSVFITKWLASLFQSKFASYIVGHWTSFSFSFLMRCVFPDTGKTLEVETFPDLILKH